MHFKNSYHLPQIRIFICLLFLLSLLIQPFSIKAASSAENLNNLKLSLEKYYPELKFNTINQVDDTLTVDFNLGQEEMLNFTTDDAKLAQFQSDLNILASQDLLEEKTHSLPKIYKFSNQGQPLFNSKNANNKSLGYRGQAIGDTLNPKKVLLSPGHGYYLNSNNQRWMLQRSYFSGIVEDFINSDISAELDQKLSPNYDTDSTRELNKNSPNHSSGLPLWQMGTMENLKSKGVPGEVWNDPGTPIASNPNLNRDLRSRPLYANYIGSKAMISIHNNGSAIPNTSCGTETWYDSSNAARYESRRLASLIQNKLISKIKSEWNQNWCDRGVKGSDGGYAENRLTDNIPSVIVELAFMDNSSDNAALQDPKFRSIATNAIAEAVDEYLSTVSYEAESLTGVGVVTSDDNASANRVSECNKCTGTVGQGGLVLSNDLEKIRLRYNVKVDPATVDLGSGPNPSLFSFNLNTYKASSPLNTQSINITVNDYNNAADLNNDGFKEFDVELVVTDADYLVQQLISSKNSLFRYDRVEILPFKKVITEKPSWTYEAENLYSSIPNPEIITDESASGGKALRGKESGFLVFGPYTNDQVENKWYKATFRLKKLDSTTPNTNSQYVVIEAFNSNGGGTLASLEIPLSELDTAYQDYSFNFYRSQNIGTMEYRVRLVNIDSFVAVDKISIYQMGDLTSFQKKFEAETLPGINSTTVIDGNLTAQSNTQTGFLVFGPYTTEIPTTNQGFNTFTAKFYIKNQGNATDNIAFIDVWSPNSPNQKQLAYKIISTSDVNNTEYKVVSLDFQAPSTSDPLEFRLYNLIDGNELRVDKIEIVNKSV
ncbi:MAG: hypothetical protein OHK0017_01560 [Patescibacteria group bacterium]